MVHEPIHSPTTWVYPSVEGGGRVGHSIGPRQIMSVALELDMYESMKTMCV